MDLNLSINEIKKKLPQKCLKSNLFKSLMYILLILQFYQQHYLHMNILKIWEYLGIYYIGMSMDFLLGVYLW